MNKLKIHRAIFAFLCVFAIDAKVAMPVILGAVLETGSGLLESGNYGTGIARITPFVGIWMDGLGFARLGASTASQKEVIDPGVSEELNRLDFSTQIGLCIIGPEMPYIALSYVRAGSYSQNSQIGDSKWNELGAGFGHRFSFSPSASLVIEAEHRWITEHYDRRRNKEVSGRRLQMNFGLVASPL
ncbi:MAG: hypothetical protein LBH25_08375 [Fibromonadaceae bacterium]|jgi:hypothetical protein|nr:hypothetical protein [Fibromonadaceae bacterium]